MTASSGSFTYGGTPPTITPTVTGLQNGETVSVLGNALDVLDHGDLLQSGRYLLRAAARAPVTRTTRSPTSGTRSRSCPAPLTVAASSGSMTYGGTAPTIAPTYAGFVER